MARRRSGTLLVTAGRNRRDNYDFVNPPLVRGSTVLHESIADMKARVARRNAGDDAAPVAYGIYGTPTHHAFYEALNALEGGHASWALPSGLTACTIAILAFVRAGDHVLVPDSVYWPTRRFCRDTLPSLRGRDDVLRSARRRAGAAPRSRRCSGRRRACCSSSRPGR